jgi:hypothetical protein
VKYEINMIRFTLDPENKEEDQREFGRITDIDG